MCARPVESCPVLFVHTHLTLPLSTYDRHSPWALPPHHGVHLPTIILLRLALIPLLIFVADRKDGLAIQTLARQSLHASFYSCPSTYADGGASCSRSTGGEEVGALAARGRADAAHAAEAGAAGGGSAESGAFQVEVVIFRIGFAWCVAVGGVEIVEAVAAVDGADFKAVVVLGELRGGVSRLWKKRGRMGQRAHVPHRTWRSGGCWLWDATSRR